MNTSITQLGTHGFVSISYPPDLRQAVVDTISLWHKFCALPEEVKRGLPYSNGADGVGYELKLGEGPSADRKENFDITLAGEQWVEQHLGSVSSDVARRFVQQASTLVGLMKPTIVQFAAQVESEFGIKGFAKEVEESEVAFFVRFIHYFGDRKIGEETATAHTDQSGFTLHLFESAPGLQCLTYDDRQWIDMPVSEGETVIIPSMQLQLRSEGTLRALCHRVVATPETAGHGRYSAVCFVQLSRTPKYDKAGHGRLQEKKPGFNYDMPHGEFVQMFK